MLANMLNARHAEKKVRNAGGRIKGPPKRTKEQNVAFEKALATLLE